MSYFQRIKGALGVQLAALLAVFLLVSVGILSETLRTLSALEENAVAVNFAGAGRTYIAEIANLCLRLESADSAERETLRVLITNALADMDSRLFRLREGDPSLNLTPPATADLAARLDRLEDRWHTMVRPNAARVIAADTEAELVERLSEMPASTAAFLEATESLLGRFEASGRAWASRARIAQFASLALLAVAFTLVLWLVPRFMEKERALERRHGTEQRIQGIIDSTRDGIITVQLDGTVDSINASAARLAGYLREEVEGQNVRMLMTSPFREQHDEYLERYLRTGDGEMVGAEREIEMLRKDGTHLPVSLRFDESSIAGTRMFIGIVHDITGRMRDRAERTALIDAMSETAVRLSSTAKEILASTTQLGAGATEQAASIAQTVATIDELAHSAAQAVETSKSMAAESQSSAEGGEAGRRVVEDCLVGIREVKEHSESVAESILSLAEQAQSIGEIISTVGDIADQTNLLALNAAIEASRAGEHGKGFSVVSSEVKALAEQSKKATAQIRAILGEIQKATNAAVMNTEQSSKSVNSVMAVVTQAGSAIGQLADTIAMAADSSLRISAAAGQQSTGMDQIRQAMASIRAATDQSVNATKQAERSAEEVSNLGAKLTEMVANLES